MERIIHTNDHVISFCVYTGLLNNGTMMPVAVWNYMQENLDIERKFRSAKDSYGLLEVLVKTETELRSKFPDMYESDKIGSNDNPRYQYSGAPIKFLENTENIKLAFELIKSAQKEMKAVQDDTKCKSNDTNKLLYNLAISFVERFRKAVRGAGQVNTGDLFHHLSFHGVFPQMLVQFSRICYNTNPYYAMSCLTKYESIIPFLNDFDSLDEALRMVKAEQEIQNSIFGYLYPDGKVPRRQRGKDKDKNKPFKKKINPSIAEPPSLKGKEGCVVFTYEVLSELGKLEFFNWKFQKTLKHLSTVLGRNLAHKIGENSLCEVPRNFNKHTTVKKRGRGKRPKRFRTWESIASEFEFPCEELIHALESFGSDTMKKDPHYFDNRLERFMNVFIIEADGTIKVKSSIYGRNESNVYHLRIQIENNTVQVTTGKHGQKGEKFLHDLFKKTSTMIDGTCMLSSTLNNHNNPLQDFNELPPLLQPQQFEVMENEHIDDFLDNSQDLKFSLFYSNNGSVGV